jgi:hypothetical protein
MPPLIGRNAPQDPPGLAGLPPIRATGRLSVFRPGVTDPGPDLLLFRVASLKINVSRHSVLLLELP